MRILVINANSSRSMTKSIEAQLNRAKRADTEISVERIREAASAIESARQAAQAIPFIIERIKKANHEEYDAAIIACFCDPGLEAAREESNILVMGIAETSFHIAAILGHKFTILTPLAHRIPCKEQDVRRYKIEHALASVRPLGLTVTETDLEPEKTEKRILEAAQIAVEKDGAEVLILGCAGMHYADLIEKELGVVVLDPTPLTFKICEALVDAGLKHSKVGLYAAYNGQGGDSG